MHSDAYLSVNEFAQLAGRTPNAIRMLLKKGTLTNSARDRRVMIHASELGKIMKLPDHTPRLRLLGNAAQ